MSRHNRPRSERGLALIATVLVLIVFLSLGAFALKFSGVDFKTANNQATGVQALYVAEAGLTHALLTINRIGVVDFDQGIVQNWSTTFYPNPGSIPGAAQFTYQVQVAADSATTGTITCAATGQNGAKRRLVARVRQATGFDGRGALYLASHSVHPSFAGAAFEISGYDHDLAGAVIAGGVTKPGIATQSDSVTSAVVEALSPQQIPGVEGLGSSASPLTPSVITSGGPNIGHLNQIINDILSRPGVVTRDESSLTGDGVFGTVDHPQITHLTNSDATLAGTISGAGILIADGSINITGNTSFTGWIIVRGSTTINTLDVWGSAVILGSLWTSYLNVAVGGHAIIDYSTQALSIAGQVENGGNPTPKSMVVTSWREVY
jgi:Tfp pilus assembly protein PilX